MIFLYMLIFVPVSLALAYLVHASPFLVFLTAAIAIVPLAVWIQRGTEELAYHTGPSIGGLLNVTFGNAAELIIALFILIGGASGVVKGQITGSIIGNGLLGLGLTIIVGTWNKSKLSFSRDQAGQLSTMLMLVLIGLLIPAVFDFTERAIARAANAFPQDEKLSLVVSVVLILLYVGNLFYTLVTHQDMFSPKEPDPEQEEHTHWSKGKALLIMIAATAFTAFESEIVSDAITATAGVLKVSTFFLGIVVLAVIGNVAEYVTAIHFVRRENMNMVMSISLGATVQVARFVAPLLVLISYLIGKPMDLVFNNPIELVAIFGVAIAVNAISKDGEVTWFEGVLLVGVYLLLAFAFLYVAPT